jgi:hypothetical protein
MTERERDIEDIDFDFFDEPETEEATERQPRVVRRPDGPQPPGGPPRRPIRPAQGFAPLLRLTGLIAFAILVVVLIVFGARRCSASSKTSEYRGYIEDVTRFASSSEQLGKELNDKLTTPGIKEADLETAINGLAQQQAQDLARAQEVVPPGPLRPEHRHLIDALQLRATGLTRLRDAFNQTAGSNDAGRAGDLLSAQGRLLTASDVIWDFYFLEPTRAELKKQGISGVAVPASDFIENPDLVTREAMLNVFRRLSGAATGGTPAGLHGTGLVAVKALPDDATLSTSNDNTITASQDLAFSVTVQDTGDNQEVQIPVTLTIENSPRNIVQQQTIDLLNPGQSKTVVFKNLDSVPFGTKTTLRVEVKAVPGEKTTTNNRAEYPVIFSLGP